MARIRTIKPKFFRHEGLQDLEVAHPGKYVMLVFAGLWGHCDREGRFEWQPRSLKLDILPFITFDMSETLDLLKDGGFVRRYQVGGKTYGCINSFKEHQRITGKEATDSKLLPAPDGEELGNACETTVKQPGAQEQEGKRNGEQEQEGERRDVSSLVSSIAKNKKMPTSDLSPNFGEAAIRKQRWQQKIIEELKRTIPDKRVEEIVSGYTRGEPWALQQFEKVDQAIKTRKNSFASVRAANG